MRVSKWPVVGGILAVVWLLVRGVTLEPAAVAGETLIGLVVGLGIAYGFRRMYLPAVDLGRAVQATPAAGYYVAVFLWELLTANADVAYRVLAPSMPIEPAVVAIPLRVESDAAITSLANSITLTPGTLTMDYDPHANTLYVHGITGRRREQTVAPIRRWEDLLLVVFEEDADPGDEPPRLTDVREPPVAGEAGAATNADGAGVASDAGVDGGATDADGERDAVGPDAATAPDEDGAEGEPVERDGGADDGR